MALKMVDPEVLEGLAEFDSATVQNAAAIVYGGYISAHNDYTGPDLESVSVRHGWFGEADGGLCADFDLDAVA